jgi:hypothetical protein
MERNSKWPFRVTTLLRDDVIQALIILKKDKKRMALKTEEKNF